jgi:hypothetical protein
LISQHDKNIPKLFRRKLIVKLSYSVLPFFSGSFPTLISGIKSGGSGFSQLTGYPELYNTTKPKNIAMIAPLDFRFRGDRYHISIFTLY